MPSAPKQKKQNAAARPTNRGPWGEDYLMTNPKSALVNADLVKLFSNPKAWDCLDEEEKKHLLSLLPTHIHPNPDPDPDNPDAKIPPLPEDFLRYDNNWRGALRNFQSDLEAGRYRIAWQRQALQAYKDRAEGKFDDFKEREFEQFWGQKQKINHGLIAGESSRIKLQTLIEHGLVRVGDVWKYLRLFSTKRNSTTRQILIEKEARIIAIDGANLSFLVPAGQRTFLSAPGATVSNTGCVEPEGQVPSDANTVCQPQTHPEQAPGQTYDLCSDTTRRGNNHQVLDHTVGDNEDVTKPSTEPSPQLPKKEDVPSKTSGRRPNKRKAFNVASKTTRSKAVKLSADSSPTPTPQAEDETPNHARPELDSAPVQPSSVSTEPYPGLNVSSFLAGAAEVAKTSASPHYDHTESTTTPSLLRPPPLEPPQAETQQQPEQSKPDVNSTTQLNTSSPPVKSQLESDSSTPLEIVIHNIAGPTALTKKILEIDGRVKHPPNGNAWKEIRCYRDNQDMGSLWEVRQAWYIKSQPPD